MAKQRPHFFAVWPLAVDAHTDTRTTQRSLKGVRKFINTTGYDSKELREFFERGAKAMGAHGLTVAVVTSPNRSRGCADVGGTKKRVVMQIAPPSKFSKKKLARLFEHEVLHTTGKEHGDMTRRQYWSEGREPAWAKGRLRYHGRGRSVMP